MLSGKRVAEVGSQTLRRGSGLIRPRNATPLVAAADALVSPQASLRGGAGVAARRQFSAAPLPKASALPSYVLNCPETQVTTLPNGLRVASEVGPDSIRSFCAIFVASLCWLCGHAIAPPTRGCLRCLVPGVRFCRLLRESKWRASAQEFEFFFRLLTHARGFGIIVSSRFNRTLRKCEVRPVACSQGPGRGRRINMG